MRLIDRAISDQSGSGCLLLAAGIAAAFAIKVAEFRINPMHFFLNAV